MARAAASRYVATARTRLPVLARCGTVAACEAARTVARRSTRFARTAFNPTAYSREELGALFVAVAPVACGFGACVYARKNVDTLRPSSLRKTHPSRLRLPAMPESFGGFPPLAPRERSTFDIWFKWVTLTADLSLLIYTNGIVEDGQFKASLTAAIDSYVRNYAAVSLQALDIVDVWRDGAVLKLRDSKTLVAVSRGSDSRASVMTLEDWWINFRYLVWGERPECRLAEFSEHVATARKRHPECDDLVVTGHSLGGAVAFHYAMLHEGVRALVYSPGGFGLPKYDHDPTSKDRIWVFKPEGDFITECFACEPHAQVLTIHPETAEDWGHAVQVVFDDPDHLQDMNVWLAASKDKYWRHTIDNNPLTTFGWIRSPSILH